MPVTILATLLLLAQLVTPGPAPSPTLPVRHLLKRDTCNGDNCLRALQGKSATATSFCNTYTDFTAPTSSPFPSYVPTTCSAQRVSSACYCLDNKGNPAYTPPACPTGNILQNPSFYGQAGDRNTDIRPWVLAVPNGSPGCVPSSGYSTADMDGPWGDPRAIECSFGAAGGKSTLTQDVKLCPSTLYRFRIHTACNFYVYPGYNFGIKYRVLFNGVVILPLQSACSYCEDPNNPNHVSYCTENVIYEEHASTFTSPASGAGSLIIEVTLPSGVAQPVVPMLMDQIYLNVDGDTSMNDPARPP